jgi:hypothetical protein
MECFFPYSALAGRGGNDGQQEARMSCPICEKRPPKRLCPAKGEKICAVCCGREREVTIECPTDCPHLVAAHRYEAEHRKPLSPEEYPYSDVEFPEDFLHKRWPVVTGLAAAILGFQAQNNDLNDGAVCIALEALAETYRILGTGIYYEQPPEHPLSRALYAQIDAFLQKYREQETSRTGFSSLKDSEIFHLLVFLLRIAWQETNGRPRARAFLSFLCQCFPLPKGATKEDPRIIVP